MATREDRTHGLTDFLSRPVAIETALWSSATTQGTQLYTTNFPDALLTQPMYRDKLRGFVGLRATLVIKVQVNSQPFQQGRLMLQYIPYAQYMQNRVALINKTLQGRSGCPRTDLDLSVGTEIEMRIPMATPHLYFNLITGQGSFGTMYLVVYSQLKDQVAGNGSVEYTVWAHLEDVDVQYPTGADLNNSFGPNFAQNQLFTHMSSELSQLATNHSVSAGVGRIAEGLKDLTRIPLVGNMFSRPAWISASMANIFKMLGFSKPTLQGLPVENKLRTQTRMCNFDGADSSHKLALSSGNAIETKPGMSGTASDEMALSHILSIPNYWDNFPWKTTQTFGTILRTDFVTPMKIKVYDDTITDRFRCTHLGFVANTFGLWRGSLVFTYKFVKTQYHSGRVMISFIPFYYNELASTTDLDISRAQRTVVDLRTSTEVSFTVPYVSTRPWMFCVRPESPLLGPNKQLQYNAVTGIVRVQVLNQLVAANNVFQEVDVILEVSGGPDLTFANPTCPNYVPYSGGLTAAAIEDVPPNKTNLLSETEDIINPNDLVRSVVPDQKDLISPPDLRRTDGSYSLRGGKLFTHMMGTNAAIPRNDAQLGASPPSIDGQSIDANWSPEANCIGEKIMSVRQLIKRFGAIGGTARVAPQAEPPTNSLVLAPFAVTTPTATPSGGQYYPQLDYWYTLFAFYRGSVRYKAKVTNANWQQPNTMFLVKMYNSLGDAMVGLLNRFATTPNIYLPTNLSQYYNYAQPSSLEIQPDLEGMLEFEVPYYNISHITPAVYTTTPTITSAQMLTGSAPPTIVTIKPSTTQSVDFTMYRAAGDDFSLSYILGVPLLTGIAQA